MALSDEELRARRAAAARALRRADPSKNAEAMRRWRAKNPDYYRKWRKNNPEASRAATKRYEQKHPETAKRWLEANPEKVRATQRRYMERNLPKFANKNHLRRARISGALEIEKVDRLKVFARDGGRCHLCGKFVAKKKFTLDHLVPLARGGSHTYANVKIAHGVCNSRKGARFISAAA